MNRFTIFFSLIILFNTYSLPQSPNKYSDIFFIDDQSGWILSSDGYLWETTNAGLNWIAIYDSQIDTSGKITFVDEQNGWMLLNTKLYFSNDGGEGWIFKYEFPQFFGLYDIAFINDSVGFVANAYNLYKTTNSGNEWTLLIDTLGSINKISCYNENLIFISSSKGLEYLYKSTDEGITWHISNEFGSLDPSRFGKVQMFNEYVGILEFDYATHIGVSTLLKTTDSGASWDTFGNGFVYIFGATDFKFISIQNGWVTTQNQSIYRTTNEGQTWDTLQTPLTLNQIINNIEFFNSNISYGISANHIYYTNDGWVTYSIVDSIVTGLKEQLWTAKEYLLEQNYPNPFNPTTVIKYQVPITSQVTLRIYDILGNEIEVLVNEEKSAGNYSYSFTTIPTLSSGIYFYQLNAGGIMQTKKMMLIK